LKSRDGNLLYYSAERKTHDRNTYNKMKPLKHKEHSDFIGEANWEKPLCFFALIEMRIWINYNVLLQY